MNSFYILRFDRDAYNALNAEVEEGEEVADDGLEEAFEAVAEVSEGGEVQSHFYRDGSMGYWLLHLHYSIIWLCFFVGFDS